MTRRLHPAERKIVLAGFAVGRRGGSPTECPHPLRQVDGRIVGRKGHLWVRGCAAGAMELERVRESYRAGLEQLDAGALGSWG